MENGTAPRRLRCCVQTYGWGRIGEGSTVARLFACNSGAEIENARPYAELWMGTHDSGPSYVVDGGGVCTATLKDWIRENADEVLGERVAERWGGDLPFLFKVLSVAKALSIQAHPDKELAGFLHKMHPDVYRDSNHKPEMAIAITEFRALCGFVTLTELKHVLTSVPEILELVGNEDAHKLLIIQEKSEDIDTKDILMSVFTKLMAAKNEDVSELVTKLRKRLTAPNKVRTLTEREWLALELEKQYPGDIGVLSSFFFNYVKLQPGEALYLGPNEPHAYISGECLECMATSDNVVRAGLTPKFRDVKTLCAMLTYKQGYPDILRGIHLNPYITRFIPPFDEFQVDYCSIPGNESVELPQDSGPSLFLILAGDGFMHTIGTVKDEVVKQGDVFFVPARIQIKLTAGIGAALQVYRAGVNGMFFGN